MVCERTGDNSMCRLVCRKDTQCWQTVSQNDAFLNLRKKREGNEGRHWGGEGESANRSASTILCECLSTCDEAWKKWWWCDCWLVPQTTPVPVSSVSTADSYRLIHASANGHLRIGANSVPGNARRLSPLQDFPTWQSPSQLIRYRLPAFLQMWSVVVLIIIDADTSSIVLLLVLLLGLIIIIIATILNGTNGSDTHTH